VVARLKPGVSVERAAADMDTVARRLAQTYREDSGVTVYLVPAGQQITGSVRPAPVFPARSDFIPSRPWVRCSGQARFSADRLNLPINFWFS
jgi:hypothetical protein